MKSFIRTSLLLLVPILTFVQCGPSKPDYNYEHTCVGTGEDGLNVLKVFSYGKTVAEAIEKSKQNAVHAVLFKGINCAGGRVQPPLTKNDDAEKHRAYFDEFFKSKKYLQYVTLSGDGSVNPKDRIKTDSGKYKVGIGVVVRRDALRKKLEADGIIRSMNSGF